MKLRMPGIIISSVLIAFISCGHNYKTVSVGPAEKNPTLLRYAVLPFEPAMSSEEKKKYPEAGEVIRDQVESGLLSAGINLVERRHIELILKEHSIAQSGLTDEDNIRLGRLVQADAIVTGKVNKFFSGDDFKDRDEYYGRYTTVGFTAKAVHVETGMILWRVSNDREVGTCFNAGIFPQSYSVETVHDIMKELTDRMRE